MLGFIIFGTRGVTYNKDGGSFSCPRCGEATYKHKRVRRFFTLYFIPIIPLDLLGEYVECTRCKDTYRLEILSWDPSEGRRDFEAEFHHAVRRVMVLMMLADGVIDDDEVKVICEIYEKMTGRPLADADVRQEAREQEGMDVGSVIGPLVGSLNDAGKELVIKAALHVAIADGEFADEEKALLADIGNALELSAAHFKGIMADLTAD